MQFNVRKSLSRQRASRPTVENEAGWLKGLNNKAPDMADRLSNAGMAVTSANTTRRLSGNRGLARLSPSELREGVTVREVAESLLAVKILEALDCL